MSTVTAARGDIAPPTSNPIFRTSGLLEQLRTCAELGASMARRGETTSPPLLTIEEYERLPEPEDHKTELVRGMVVREPLPSPYHGRWSG